MHPFVIRPYRRGDAVSLARLFFASVHALGRSHYTPEPVGFLELEPIGHLAMLYRLPGPSGLGAAEVLYQAAEQHALELGLHRLHTESSLVAESFFTRRGFRLFARESVARHGVLLARARMAKTLTPDRK